MSYKNNDVPIIPQKKFARGMKEKQTTTIQRQESLENVTNNAEMSPMSSAAITTEISSFLLEEAKRLALNEPSKQHPQPPNYCDLTQQRNHNPPAVPSPEHQGTASPNSRTIVTSVTGAKLTTSNVNDGAKLAVAFGFWLDDHGSTKTFAQIAAHKWVTRGQSAEQDERMGSSGPKHGSPEESQKTPTRDAKSPKYELAGPDFPAGWTTRLFERTKSENAYKNYYSPATKYRFRTKKAALAFVKLSEEPGINSEQRAFTELKTRGHGVTRSRR